MDFLSGFSLIICFIALINISLLTKYTHINRVALIITILYITSFLLNFFHALFVPASRALIPNIVKENQYQQANSLSNISMNINNIIGILAGGLIFIILKPEGIILLNGISFIISGISEMFIKERKTNEEIENETKETTSHFADFIEALRYIKREAGLKEVIILAILLNFFLTPLFAIIPQYLFNQVLEKSAFEFSLTGVFFSLSAILISIYLTLRKQPEKVYRYLRNGLITNFLITFVMLGLIYTILENIITFIPFMIGYCLIMFLFGMVVTTVNVPLEVALMKKIDKNMFGRVIAIFGTFVGFSLPISIVFFSSLVDAIGLIYTLMILVFGGVIGIIYLLFNKRLREI